MMTKYEQYVEKKPSDNKVKIVKKKKRAQSCSSINKRPFIEYFNSFKECYDFYIPLNHEVNDAFEVANYFED